MAGTYGVRREKQEEYIRGRRADVVIAGREVQAGGRREKAMPPACRQQRMCARRRAAYVPQNVVCRCAQHAAWQRGARMPAVPTQ